MTIGEDRVRIQFNPSDNSLVSQLKQKTAELIDLCEAHKHDQGRNPPDLAVSETIRCWVKAQDAFEDAAMWAVKAATA